MSSITYCLYCGKAVWLKKVTNKIKSYTNKTNKNCLKRNKHKPFHCSVNKQGAVRR